MKKNWTDNFFFVRWCLGGEIPCVNRRAISAALYWADGRSLFINNVGFLSREENPAGSIQLSDVIIHCIWRLLIFSIVSCLGAVITEISWPDPDVSSR